MLASSFQILCSCSLTKCFLCTCIILRNIPTALTVACTIGTQTQDKKNRKKRAFLDRNNEAQQKKLKNLKVTDKSKDAYDTYILRRCIRKPVDNEKR
jgi:hypothetical protein